MTTRIVKTVTVNVGGAKPAAPVARVVQVAQVAAVARVVRVASPVKAPSCPVPDPNTMPAHERPVSTFLACASEATTVVNRKNNLPYDVYIGRGSPYGNPFTHVESDTPGVIRVATREEAIRRYRGWLLGTEKEPAKYGWTPPDRDKVLALKGKVLGCYCKPLDCHGDVLVALIEEHDRQVDENQLVGFERQPEPELEPLTGEDDGKPAPFLRWVGGKRLVAADLAARILDRLAPGGAYFEPFLGSGAVALALPRGTRMVLGDFSAPLGGLWWWLKRNAGRLAEAIPPAFYNTEERYYEHRDLFNAGKFNVDDPTPSALFLWLNHTNYNGVYRENKNGGYNVPFGKRKTISLPSELQLRRVGEHLRTAQIMVGTDFAETVRGATRGDVVFLDPPYDGTFDDYTAGGFGADGQTRLAQVMEALVCRGVHVLMTNADTPRIRELYGAAPWTIEDVAERRSVAADSDNRKDAKCVLVIGTPEPRR
jgi:DNA adenine methylase